MITLPDWLQAIVARLLDAFGRETPASEPTPTPIAAPAVITADLLVRCTGCALEHAALYAEHLDDAAHRWGIDTPVRQAAWLAQLAYESVLFSRAEESLYYTTPARLIAVWPSRFRLPVGEREDQFDIFVDGKRNARRYVRDPQRLANFVYGARMGNGDEDSGDGWAFHGRGLIMLTGRDNYTAYQAASRQLVIGDPDLVADPFGAAHSAGWYWRNRALNVYADRQDWAALTRAINGGTLGLEDRERLTVAAMQALA